MDNFVDQLAARLYLGDRPGFLKVMAEDFSNDLQFIVDNDLITQVDVVAAIERDNLVVTIATILHPDDLDESAADMEASLVMALCGDCSDCFIRKANAALEFEVLSEGGRRGIGFEISQAGCSAKGAF